ncbi:MAG TPA: hypothetical protein VM513_21620 [Kofleriaceae bacterium]|nr:hypothetical protein [Kofleriaceae bacterium]
MRILAILLVAVGLAPSAWARPNADVVIVWAPGQRLGPIQATAREAGAAVIDRSPLEAVSLPTASLVKRGIAAYDALELERAKQLLDEARTAADRSGAAELSQGELSDLFLYRGLVKIQAEDTTGAWDELVTAITVAPTRVLDPARFPPRVASELERVRATLAERPRAKLEVTAPAGCTVSIDGVAVAAGDAATPRLHGPHWVRVACSEYAPWGTRVELTGDTTIAAGNARLVPPSADEALIQARTVGARAYVVVEIAGHIATTRLYGIDGRERDRRTLTVVTSLDPVAKVVGEMLVTHSTASWYESRWVWAAGAALVVAAILIPITASVADDTPTDAVVRPATPGEWRR